MKKLPLAIWAMVIGAFAMGADEFIVAGVVREIAQGLNVSYGAVGALESVYALGVAIGAPVFTAIGTRFGRRSMLLLTTGVFLAGNIVSALGPTYEAIVAGRIISATAHGAFLGIAAVLAAELVDPARRGRAVALVFTGLTASTVLGAPIGAAVGQWLGWRFTFWTLVIFGGIALLGLMLSLPRRGNTSADVDHNGSAPSHNHHEHSDPVHGNPAPGTEYEGLDAHALAHLGGGGQGPTMREQLSALTRPAVWGALLTTMLGYGGVFTSYVYIAPQLTEVTGFGEVWITPLLLLVMNAAGHAPDVASAANISAFTLGSAIGIALGGRAIDGGLGLTSVNWVGALITTAGLIVAVITWALLDRRTVAAPARDQRTQDHHHEPGDLARPEPSQDGGHSTVPAHHGHPADAHLSGHSAGQPTASMHAHS